MARRVMIGGGLAAAVVFAAACSAAVGEAPAVGWRYDGSGHFPQAEPPLAWSAEENIAWKTATSDRSLASPIVVDGRVFVLAEPAELVCLSAADGTIAWQKSHGYRDVFDQKKADVIETDLAAAEELQKQTGELHRQRQEAQKAGNDDLKQSLQARIDALQDERKKLIKVYRPLPRGNAANTGSTPASDGENVFALFGTGVVSSHTLAGERNWMTFVEGASGDQTASPVLADGKLIIHLRKLHALDAETGELLWSADADQRHGTPVAAHVDGTSLIVTPGGAVVRLADGEMLSRGLFRLGHSSPIVHEGIVYAMEDGATKAIKLSAEKDGSTLLWESEAARSNRLASPIYHEGLLYCVNEQGVLEVSDATGGERVYRKRLSFSGGRLDPSLCLAGGRLYITNNRGATLVLRPGREFEQLARNELGEDFSSSPAFAGGRIYFRTRKHVVCVGE